MNVESPQLRCVVQVGHRHRGGWVRQVTAHPQGHWVRVQVVPPQTIVAVAVEAIMAVVPDSMAVEAEDRPTIAVRASAVPVQPRPIIVETVMSM